MNVGAGQSGKRRLPLFALVTVIAGASRSDQIDRHEGWVASLRSQRRLSTPRNDRSVPHAFLDGGGVALDDCSSFAHTGAMAHLRIALMAASLLFLSGCASGPTGPVLAYPPASSIRPNTQPKMLPCMIGDVLCTPQT